jgi:hypothetical protein
LIWTVAFFMAGVLGGMMLARHRNDAEARLARQFPAGPEYGTVMPRVRLDRPTFREAITSLAALSHANIQADWAELAAEKVDCNKRLHLQLDLRNVTLDRVLPIIINSQEQQPGESSPVYSGVANGGISIFGFESPLRQSPAVVRMYDVRDVLKKIYQEREKFPDEQPLIEFGNSSTGRSGDEGYLIEMIEESVASDSWNQKGGSVGEISSLNGRLAILQTPDAHEEIAKFLAEMREPDDAEKLPDPPKKQPPANPVLSRSLGEISLQDVSLQQAVNVLRRKSGANVFVNWADLEHVGIYRADRIDLSLANASVEQFLVVLTAKLNEQRSFEGSCGWGVRGMIVIGARAHLEMRIVYPVFYPVDDLLAKLQAHERLSLADAQAKLIAAVRRDVAPAKWDLPAPPDADGTIRRLTVSIWAGNLLVMQTMTHHREIEKLLSRIREGL